MAIAAVICCTMAASMLTACGSDDDDSVEFVQYHAEPANSNILGLPVATQMNTAISSAFGSDVAYKRDDSKAISICDEVANKNKNAAVGTGTINLMVSFSSSDPNATGNTKVIKTYKFPSE